MFNRIITSTNEDSTYLDFWKIQIMSHRIFFPDKILTIAFLTDRDENDELILEMKSHGIDVRLYKPNPNIPEGNQAKVLRYICASEFKDEVCVITDMDTIPLQSEYLNFITSNRELNKILCVGSEVYYGTPHSGKFPAHHITSEGKLFKKLFNPNNLSYGDLITDLSNINNVYDNKESLLSNNFSDESLIRVLFERNNVERQNHPRNINIKEQWIDRSWWGIDKDRLYSFNYIEANLLRPYNTYKDKIHEIEMFLNSISTKKFSTKKKDMFSIANECLNFFKGNIIEIGAGNGDSTKEFLEITKSYGHDVIVIDPFEDGWDDMPETYGKPYPYKIFNDKVKNYNNLKLVKKSSMDDDIYDDLINHLPISFSFVDGLQYKDAVISDLNLMKKLNCNIICVDDFTRNTKESQVPLAIDEFLTTNNDYIILHYEEIPVRAKVFLIKKELYEN